MQVRLIEMTGAGDLHIHCREVCLIRHLNCPFGRMAAVFLAPSAKPW